MSGNLQFAHFADSNPICATLCPKATCRLMGGAQYSQKKISNIWLINNWLDFAVCCYIFWACAIEATTMNNNSNIWQHIRDWNSKSNILQYVTIRLVPYTISSIYLGSRLKITSTASTNPKPLNHCHCHLQTGPEFLTLGGGFVKVTQVLLSLQLALQSSVLAQNTGAARWCGMLCDTWNL